MGVQPMSVWMVAIFLKYEQCALSFEISHKSRNAHFGRDTDQHMYVIRAHLSLNYFYSFPLAKLAEYLSYFYPLSFKENFSPIFWRKHNMVLAIPACMC